MFAGYLGMAAGGWGAGALYDLFGVYLPAFGVGIAFNLLNMTLLFWLVLRQHGLLREQPAIARGPTS